jgi:hypothetical protein
LVRRVGEVIRELEGPIDGGFIVRVYGSSSQGRWRAWLEFISLQHGNLSRSAVVPTFPDREALAAWALGLGDDDIRAALEDAELVAARDLGRIPAEEARV